MIAGRHGVTFALLAIVAANFAMMTFAVARCQPYFAQPGAVVCVFEAACALLVYAALAVWLGWRTSPASDAIRRTAILFGCVGGLVEALQHCNRKCHPVYCSRTAVADQRHAAFVLFVEPGRTRHWPDLPFRSRRSGRGRF
jgi:hypothetical protein